MVRICLQCRRPEFDPWVGKIPRRRQLEPTLAFLPGKFHGQGTVAGYSPWDNKEFYMTEQLQLFLKYCTVSLASYCIKRFPSFFH